MALNRRWWWVLAGILAAAAWLRTANLGTFSMWSDEVFTVTTADQPFRVMLAACARDADNVPLYLIIAKAGLWMGASESSLRLASIAAGLASIVLFAIWTRRRFGPEVSLLTASFCALSTFHIRYSQELRAYPYLLLVCGLTLLATDRIRRSPDWRSVGVVAAVVAIGCYTHLVYPLVLVPAAVSLVVAEPDASGNRRPGARVWRAFAAGISLGAAAFIPWVFEVASNLAERMPRPWVTEWSWAVVGNRWQVWTVAVRETDPITALGLALAGLAVVGLVVALREHSGAAVIVSALPTVVLWELFLLAIHHWSNSRYNIPQWPFVALLVGLGCERILVLVRRRWLRIVAGSVMVAVLLVPVSVYHRVGRPHWDRLATVIGEVRRPGEPVLTTDHRARRSLAYYLGGPVTTIAGQPDGLAVAFESTPSLLLVSRDVPLSGAVDPGIRSTELADVPGTARVLRLERGG